MPSSYFCVLGSNPALSAAEIFTKLRSIAEDFLLSDDRSLIFFSAPDELDLISLIKSCGGTVKIGRILTQAKSRKPDAGEISTLIWQQIETNMPEGKFPFGISVYGRTPLEIKQAGMQIKDFLKERGVSSRWVVSREKNLSSVVVETNKLTSRGIEIVIAPASGQLMIGRTLAVQPFRELSFRDYGRPARDDHSGMLPPKLAQIMINLSSAKKNAAILDPFCGSGTILSEAMLMGFENLTGSDISSKAITDTKANCLWIQKKFPIASSLPKLKVADSATLSRIFKSNEFDAIITEPFLGPQRGIRDFHEIAVELSALYSKSINEFSKILKPDSRTIMVWPVFNKSIRLNPRLGDFKINSLLPPELATNQANLTDRGTIIYGREGQKVWREIVVLEKK